MPGFSPNPQYGDLYVLKTIKDGSRVAIDFDSQKEGLIKNIDSQFPFPFERDIKNNFGEYKVPFLKSDRTQDFFKFPSEYGSIL